MYQWDDKKREANLREHGIDFGDAHHFDWETATISIDDRENYGELREMAIGFIGGAAPHDGFHASRRQYPNHKPAQGESERDEALRQCD